MTGDAGPEQTAPARRPGRAPLIALAVLLLLGGGTAVGVGIAGQDADPPVPASSTATGTPSSPAPAPAPAPPAPPAPAAPSATPVALPGSLRIPAIDVESEVISLGLQPDGSLAVPQPGPDYDKAAWFDGSPRPGQVGPSVIEGHVDSAESGPSVFYRLGDLEPGDVIDVTREDGTVVSFTVDEVRVVPKDDFPTFDVYANTDAPELRLITCGGPFDDAARSYVDNIVVFASLTA